MTLSLMPSPLVTGRAGEAEASPNRGSLSHRGAPARNLARGDHGRRIGWNDRGDRNGCRHVGRAIAGPAEGRPHRRVLAQGLPRRALRPAAAHRRGTGGSTAAPTPASSSSTRRRRRRSRRSSGSSTRCGSRSGTCSSRDFYGPTAPAPGRRRHQRVVRVPAGGAVAVHRRQGNRHVVEPRLRARGRPQPAREPLRRVRPDAATRRGAAYLDRSQAPARDGHPGGRRRVRLDRLGLGRVVVRLTKDYMHFSHNGH